MMINSFIAPIVQSLTRARSGGAGFVPLHGYNLNPPNYFDSTYAFLNLVKNSAGLAGSANTTQIGSSMTVDGWILGIPTGTTSTPLCTIALNMGAIQSYFPPGNYEVVCSNTNLTFTMAASAGISAITSGAGGCTFTASDLSGAWNTMTVQVKVANSSGSSQDLTDLRVNLISDRAALLAGGLFKQNYVDAHAGAKVIRIHDWQGTDRQEVAWRRKFTDLGAQNESQISWAGSNPLYGNTPDMPVSVGVKFAKAVGARPWLNLPLGQGQCKFRFTASTQTFSTCFINSSPADQDIAHEMNEGDPFMFIAQSDIPRSAAPLLANTIYYAKNVTSTTFQVSLTALGSLYTGFVNGTVISTTGNTTNGSPIITGIPSTTGLQPGHLITCANFTTARAILTVDSSTQVTMGGTNGSNATATSTGIAMTFGGDQTSFQTASTISPANVDPYTDMFVPMLTAMKTADPACNPIVEAGGENWNSGFPTNHWCTYIGGYLSGAGNNGHAWINLQLWKAAETVFGAGNFTLAIGGQGGFFQALGSAFDYVDITGGRSPGVSLKQQCITAMAAGYSVPPVIYVTGNYMSNSPTTLNDAYVANGNSTSIPDAYWDGSLITTTGSTINGSKVITGIPSTTGMAIGDFVSGPGTATWFGTNVTIASVDGPTQITVSANANLTGSRTITTGNRFAGWIQQCSEQVQNLLQGDLLVRAKVPNIPLAFYECGQQVTDGSTTSNEVAVGTNLISYFNGAAGAAMYASWVSKVFAPLGTGLYTAAHFTGCGGQLNSGGGFAPWPICPPNAVDTPRATYWKTI